jgi:hypothetical protein
VRKVRKRKSIGEMENISEVSLDLPPTRKPRRYPWFLKKTKQSLKLRQL